MANDIQPSIAVRKLPPNAVGAAARLLTRAFAADPVLTYFMNGTWRRAVAFPAFFRAVLLENLPHDAVYGAWSTDRLIGVSAWIPPDAPTAPTSTRWRCATNHTIVRVLFPLRSRGIYRGFSSLAALHPRSAHWYLPFVGIDPEHQGLGVGALLLKPVLQRADREGRLCYLETPFPRTHAFYQRLGFELGPAIRPFPGAPPVWTMLRKP